MTTRFLVTGSSGTLGEALVRTLRDANQDVVGVDVKPSPYTDVVASITDRPVVRKCITDVHTVFHAATLHKPHVATHSKSQFVDTNIQGTLTLLEESVAAGVKAFVFTSTTSAFGDALNPAPGTPAAWVTESVASIPRNIYGVSKSAAEDFCWLFHRKHDLPCLILRTSRFFPEEDDNRATREAFADGNAKANEFLFRRVDLEDVVSAHLLAHEHAADIGYAKYIISATTPFLPEDVAELNRDAAIAVRRRVPEFEAVYDRLGWKMFNRINRVYVNNAARRDLQWTPKYDFRHVLHRLDQGMDPRSEIARAVGSKRYHAETFPDDGPYPVE